MLKALRQIIDGLTAMVNTSENVQMSQQFAAKGKNDGTIFVSRIGRIDKGHDFRFSFGVEGNRLLYFVSRGTSLTDKLVPRTVITSDDSTPGALGEMRAAVGEALRQLSAMIETLENGNPL
jgi:hypothetical protein